MLEIYRFITLLGIETPLFIKQYPLKFMSGNTWWSTKVVAKLQPGLVIFSIISSDISLDFHKLIFDTYLYFIYLYIIYINIYYI